MKKIVFASLVASSALLAGDWYVGVDVSRESASDTITATLPQGYVWSNGSNVASASGATYYNVLGLKAGYIISDRHRAVVMYQKSSKQNGMSHQALIASYAYTPTLFTNLKGSIGVHAGYVNAEQDKIGTFDAFDMQGTVVGANIGVIYSLNKNNELEFGYRYSVASMGDESVRASNAAGTIVTNANVSRTDSKIGQIYLGYNYRF